MDKTAVELFAGVGGFRVGLNDVKLVNGVTKEKKIFDIIWANQWEPNERNQFAFNCYVKRFGANLNHVNEDISKIDKTTIPNHTLLVGGFPCQDYSVARSISGEQGIKGKKGVLWWEIHKVIEAKKPPFVLLENVDRLLKSPSKQRGRDFSIMLRTLNDLDYFVEWRVINAADYGYPQRRRRVFIFAANKSTQYYKKIHASNFNIQSLFFNQIFKTKNTEKIIYLNISKSKYSIFRLSEEFIGSFENWGYSDSGIVQTMKVIPVLNTQFKLIDLLERGIVDHKFFEINVQKFKFLKGAKKIPRSKNDNKYIYSEGNMNFPDNPYLPARTMLTSEGTTNRSSHVISDPLTNKFRFLTPLECERINQFPDDWTNTNMPFRKRYFVMGNALVTGLIKKMGRKLIKIIDLE